MNFSTRVSVVVSTWIVILVFNREFLRYAQGKAEKKPYYNGLCTRDQFRCLNERCIDRQLWCNGVFDCEDRSDESYCRHYYNSCPQAPYSFVHCVDEKRCIPRLWVCDNRMDCSSGSDEVGCLNAVENITGSIPAQSKLVQWFLNQKKGDKPIEKWGTQVPRIAVALYLTDNKFFSPSNRTGEQITYELSNLILAAVLRNQTESMSPNELALYVHAMLVTCLDARDFHGVDLVAILRRYVDTQLTYTNPFILLVLCNAKDTMTTKDVDKLTSVVEVAHRPIWTGTRALALMALSCIIEKSDVTVDSLLMTELALELKQLQLRNGSIENLYTTALVTQSLFASGEEEGDDWDMEDAIKYLIRSQASDGSYENLLTSYYVLPVLKYKSLLNVSSAHCTSTAKDDETTTLEVLQNKLGTKIHMKYHLWFGDKKDLARSLELRTMANSTLFNIMNLAAALDFRYRFKHTIVHSKPYVYELSGIQDDPEKDTFWFLYKIVSGSSRTLVNSSSEDVIPKDKEEFIMWYRTGNWNHE